MTEEQRFTIDTRSGLQLRTTGGEMLMVSTPQSQASTRTLVEEMAAERQQFIARIQALEAEVAKANRELGDAGRLIEAIDDKLEAAEAERDRLRAALLLVTEHMDRAGGDGCGMPECPWCHAQEDDQAHRGDCELMLARQVLAGDSQP